MDPTPIDKRKWIRKRHHLSLNEKMDIVYQIMCLNHIPSDLAKEYRVTKACISLLIKKANKNEKFITELILKRDEQKDRT